MKFLDPLTESLAQSSKIMMTLRCCQSGLLVLQPLDLWFYMALLLAHLTKGKDMPRERVTDALTFDYAMLADTK